VKSPAGMGLLTGGTAPAFNGQYASIFPGAYLVAQTDLGLAYSGTLRPNPGNGGTAGFNLSGSFVGPRVPITVVNVDVTPVIFNVYFDGGSVPAMTNVNFGVGIATPLTGAGAGISLTRTAGVVGFEDYWQATASVFPDQSGNGMHFIQSTDASRPIVTPGLNGKPGLLFDGVNDFMTSNVNTLLTAFPFELLIVGRFLQPAASNQCLVGANALTMAVFMNAPNQIRQYCGGGGNLLTFSSNAPTRFAATFTDSAADRLQAGAAFSTGTNAGSNPPATAGSATLLGAFPITSGIGNIEIFAIIITPPVASLAQFDAAINSAQGYGPGAIAV